MSRKKSRKKSKNPVKKFMEVFNKPKTFTDRKKEERKQPSEKIDLEEYDEYE